MMTVSRAWWFFSLFCQTLRWAGAAAPGDEDGACGVPEYSAGIEVLMDSWRYQSLLAESSSVWETETSERGPGSSDLWYGVGGTCEQGGVEVCLSGDATSWVFTQYISKPSSVDYPVRVHVGISYTLTQCNNDCRTFELLKYVANTQNSRKRSDEQNYEHNGIEPDSEIPRDGIPNYNTTTTLYFDLEDTEQGFYLSIEADEQMCVTISRLLVYINTCPYTERGLARYPSTPIPLTISTTAVGSCAANAHHTDQSVPDTLRCSILGIWSSDEIRCECDQGYYQDGNNCRAYLTPVQNPYTVRERQRGLQVCLELPPGLPLSLELQVSSTDNTAIGNFDYVPVSTSIRRSQFTTSSSLVVGCVDITIVDDDLKEKEESFVVEVTNGSIVLARVTVNIESSDGENACSEGSVTVVNDTDNSSLQLVEMCNSEGVWSPLCDNEWTPQDAAVICREAAHGLNLNAYQVARGSSQSFWAYDCMGIETHFTQCTRYPYSDTVCYHLLVQCGTTVSQTTLDPHTSPTPTSTTITTTTTTTTQTDSTLETGTDSVSPSIEANKSRSSSRTNRIIAGVVVSLLIIIALVVIAVAVGIFLYWRRKKYDTQEQTKDIREVDNPVYEGARHIVFRTPPPVILPSDPIYERAGAHKSALPFSAIFDDSVYAGGTVLSPQSTTTSKRGNKLSAAVESSIQPPLYEVISDHTHSPTHQSGADNVPEIQNSDGSVPHKEIEEGSNVNQNGLET